MLDRIGVDQPRWKELSSMDDINQFVEEVGFPVLVRPSYVLSGAAMNVCSNQEELVRFLELAANVSKKHPVVVSQFIEQCKEWKWMLWLRTVRSSCMPSASISNLPVSIQEMLLFSSRRETVC